MTESIGLGTIIVPDERTVGIIRALGKKLSGRFENYYAIDDKTYIPHVSIYQGQYPNKNVELVKSSLQRLASNLKSFEIKTGPYELHYTYVWWNLLENHQLTGIHYRTLFELNSMREGLLLPHLTPTGYTTGEKFTRKEEAENVQKYGAVVVGRLFKPHITLARLKFVVNEKEVVNLLPEIQTKFKVTELYLGEMGDHGVIKEILGRFPVRQGK